MKKDRGISLITLVVTIIVMIILVGIVGVYSIDTIKNGHKAVAKRELENVRDFVIRQCIRMGSNEFDINLEKYPEIELSSEKIYALSEGKLNNQEISNIISVNSADDLDNKYKYYYLQADKKYFEDEEFSNSDITVRDVKNDYIINFYTGTIICITDGYFDVDGIIKGVDEIKLSIEE